jgi:putative glutamine amidotransferase
VNQQRDDFEFLLVRETFERGLPVLAVCRGMQVVNVALGGTLITDLRSTTASENFLAHHQINDTELHYEDYAHDIAITSGSLLQEILGTQHCAVNSFHHQAIDTLSSDLHPVARSSDGVIEAVEFKKPGKGFFIGLQWHPEVIAQDPLTVRLYQYFGRTCSTAVK